MSTNEEKKRVEEEKKKKIEEEEKKRIEEEEEVEKVAVRVVEIP